MLAEQRMFSVGFHFTKREVTPTHQYLTFFSISSQQPASYTECRTQSMLATSLFTYNEIQSHYHSHQGSRKTDIC